MRPQYSLSDVYYPACFVSGPIRLCSHCKVECGSRSRRGEEAEPEEAVESASLPRRLRLKSPCSDCVHSFKHFSNRHIVQAVRTKAFSKKGAVPRAGRYPWFHFFRGAKPRDCGDSGHDGEVQRARVSAQVQSTSLD